MEFPDIFNPSHAQPQSTDESNTNLDVVCLQDVLEEESAQELPHHIVEQLRENEPLNTPAILQSQDPASDPLTPLVKDDDDVVFIGPQNRTILDLWSSAPPPTSPPNAIPVRNCNPSPSTTVANLNSNVGARSVTTTITTVICNGCLECLESAVEQPTHSTN